MPHIHELIDFIVSAWIVYNNRVLLVFHKGQEKWLPVGGHIELDEDPEVALFREVKEECGLEIEVLGEKAEHVFPTTKPLYVPVYMDIHPITNTHRHVGLEYFARAKSDKVALSDKEHKEIRWFTEEELDDPHYNIQADIKYFAKAALKKARKNVAR